MRQNCAFGLTIWYIASISRRFVCNYWTCLNWWCNVYGYFELFIKHFLLINQRISQLYQECLIFSQCYSTECLGYLKCIFEKPPTLLHFPSWPHEAGHGLFFIKITNIICKCLVKWLKNIVIFINMTVKHESCSQIAASWR